MSGPRLYDYSPKTCVACGGTFSRPANQRGAGWAQRQYCSVECSSGRWGTEAPAYKPDAGYFAVHSWIARNWTKTGRCETCGAMGTQWANLDGRYDRTRRESWAELCPACHKLRDERAKRPDDGKGDLTCPRCQTTKPVTEFGRNTARASGRQTYCLPCTRAYMKSRRS